MLTENPDDLKKAFEANFAWLDASAEIWVYARKLEECSTGMKLEVERAFRVSGVLYHGVPFRGPHVVWMPPPFEAVEKELASSGPFTEVGALAECTRCKRPVAVRNRMGVCLACFADGTPA